MDAGVPDMSDDQPVVFRGSWLSAVMIAGYVLLLAGIDVLVRLMGSAPAGGWPRSLVFLVIGLSGVPLRRRTRVELRPDRLVVVNFRRHELPWPQVHAITLRPGRRPSSPPRVWVETATGSLRVAALGGGPAVERVRIEGRAAQLSAYWLAHRGPAWPPAPGAGPGVGRGLSAGSIVPAGGPDRLRQPLTLPGFSRRNRVR